MTLDLIHPADLHIGKTVRSQRKLAGWSQERLARSIGVSFQQLQKYERGSNRISASKVVQISGALEVPVSALFAGAPGAYEPEAGETAAGVPLAALSRDSAHLRDLAASIHHRLERAAGPAQAGGAAS